MLKRERTREGSSPAMAVLREGAPAVSGHGKALRGAQEFCGDHTDLLRLPKVWVEASVGFVRVRGGAAVRARRC